jgi:hypothetical protein
MFMSGGNQSEIIVTLRNPLDYTDTIEYFIQPLDNSLAKDWIQALKDILQKNNVLEKNFCFMGFPKTQRNIELLCKELNQAIYQINMFNSSCAWLDAGLTSYTIEDYFVPESVRYGLEYPLATRFGNPPTNSEDRYLVAHLALTAKHEILNRLHNHFEKLQGTVNNLSPYYIAADYETKYAIRQLNIICHEMETLILSQQKQAYVPEWSRPSQITTWLHAPRYTLTNQHKKLFVENGYNREFGVVYMHWAQIGKTLFEVFRDENAPELTATICEAITNLKYYSGEFDVEWGESMIYGNPKTYWFNEQQDLFREWLSKNELDYQNPDLSLGHLPIGKIDLVKSFGTTDKFEIWDILSSHLDIYSVEIDDTKAIYEYCWSDKDYKQMQIDMMKPGYDYSSSRRG